MKRITDIYNNLDDRELYHNQEELINIKEQCLDEAETKRILQKALKSIYEENISSSKETKRRHRIFTKKRWGMLIAAAALFATITASAAEYFHLKEGFASFLGVSSTDHASELESMVSDIHESKNGKTEDEKNGVKISADQVISDGETIYIYFDITLPDGVFQENSNEQMKTIRFHKNTYQIGQTQIDGVKGMEIQKSDGDDKYYAIAQIGLESLNDESQEITMKFNDLGCLATTNESTDWIDLVPGEWTLNWNLENESVAQIYPVHKEFVVKTGTVVIQSVRLSPLSIKLIGSSDSPVPVLSDQISIEGIIMKDGSFNDLLDVGYTGPEKDSLVLGGTFKNIVSVNQIKGVRINGEDFIFGE